MIGVLITTTGILFLVVGLIGASIEVYAQLTVDLLQQQLSNNNCLEYFKSKEEKQPLGETKGYFLIPQRFSGAFLRT